MLTVNYQYNHCMVDYNRLSNGRRSKVDTCKTDAAKKQRMVAGALLEHALVQYGVKQPFIYETSADGKPFLKGDEMPYFSISHCDEMSACVVSASMVGVDIEKLGRGNGKISKRFFTPNEMAYLGQFVGEEWDKVFTMLWTAKEAVAKCIDVSAVEICQQSDFSALVDKIKTANTLLLEHKELTLQTIHTGQALYMASYEIYENIIMCVSEKPSDVRFELTDILWEKH